MNRRILLAASAAALVAGCASPWDTPDYNKYALENIMRQNQKAAAELASGLKRSDIKAPVMVTTVVNLDKITESSSLGRLISEQIAAGLVAKKLPVIEVRMRDALFIKSTQGELMLSREVQELSNAHRASHVVVGTYTVSGSTIFVTLKAVNPDTNVVAAAHTYSMPMGSFRNIGF